MRNGSMKEIIRLCLETDKLAEDVYLGLAEKAASKDLADFWNRMAAEEKQHAGYWRHLLEWAEKGMLPRLFDNPKEIVAELKTIYERCLEVQDMSREAVSTDRAFLLAFKLEFYLLHPAYENLFIYNKTISESDTIEKDYEAHISRLFDALRRYDLASMELQLLGETIHRIWEENKKMAVLSNYDPLTGILNRRGLFNAINPLSHLAQRNKAVVGVMMIDIDNFKHINDEFGHQLGDEVLKYVASTINANIRASDLLGRYGGEEFLVFLSMVNPPALFAVGQKIRQAIETNFQHKARVTVSIGMSHGTINKNVEKDLNHLIRTADTKLYEAKASGKNKVAY